MRLIAWNDKEMNLLVDNIEKLNEEKYYGALYNIEADRKSSVLSAKSEGREDGFKDGFYLTKVETAKNLKANGVDIEIISKSTGLSKEEVEKL